MTYKTRENKEMMNKVTYCSTEMRHEATLNKLSVVEVVFPSLILSLGHKKTGKHEEGRIDTVCKKQSTDTVCKLRTVCKKRTQLLFC